jgi:hypothetical protein
MNKSIVVWFIVRQEQVHNTLGWQIPYDEITLTKTRLASSTLLPCIEKI